MWVGFNSSLTYRDYKQRAYELFHDYFSSYDVTLEIFNTLPASDRRRTTRVWNAARKGWPNGSGFAVTNNEESIWSGLVENFAERRTQERKSGKTERTTVH